MLALNSFGQTMVQYLERPPGNVVAAVDRLQEFFTLLSEEPRLLTILQSGLGEPQLAAFWQTLQTGLAFLPHEIHLLRFLAQQRSLMQLGKLLPSLAAYCREQQQERRVKVTVAHPLTEVQRQALQQGLTQRLGQQVVLQEYLDRQLMGGMVVEWGDWRLDSSLRSQLQTWRRNYA